MSASRNGKVAEVAEQGAVAREEQLHGVVPPERAVVHLAVEVADRPLEQRPHRGAEVDAEVAFAVECLPAHDPDELGVLLEEGERHVEHEVDLLPASSIEAHGLLDLQEPVRERPFEHLAVQRFLRGEVVEQARTPDADSRGDVVERRSLVALVGEAAGAPLRGSPHASKARARCPACPRHATCARRAAYLPVGRRANLGEPCGSISSSPWWSGSP